MYKFKFCVINQSGKSISRYEVVAPSMVEAEKQIQNQMWWDCYQPEEYLVNFTGKQRV